MQIITNLLSPATYVGMTLLVAALWIWHEREYWRPVLLAGALGATFVIASLMKSTIQRERPPLHTMIPPLEIDYSFPSGHTIGTAVFLLILGYLLYSRQPSTKRLAIWSITALVGVLLIALSRLYLGYHWISDIGASISLALIILAAVIIIDTLVPRRLSLNRRAS